MVELEPAQALGHFGWLRGEDLPKVAQRLVEDGFDDPTPCELAALRHTTLRDAGPMFLRILRQLGRPTLPVAEAQKIVAHHFAKAIVAGTVEPRDGADRLTALFHASDRPKELEVFRGFWASYDDGPNGTGVQEAFSAGVDARVIAEARALLAMRQTPAKP